MSFLIYVLNLVMFRSAILILDVCSPTPKLVTSIIIIHMYIINNSGHCKITDYEVTVISQLKWPNLKTLRLCKYVLN
jgi:hypothetical protein